MRKISFKKNWQDILAYLFFTIAVIFYIFFLLPHNCSGFGCVFLFGLIGISMFLTLIFIIIALMKLKFVKKNIIIGLLWLVFSVVLLNEVRIGSTLSRSYMKFKQYNECLDMGGKWNSKEYYYEISPETIIRNHILDTKILVPETENLSVTFDDIKSDSINDYLYGTFSDKEGFDKGSVVGYHYKIKKVSKNLFVMPFSVNYGGSGTFFYVGLFSCKDNSTTRKEKKKINYLEAYLLGDRVKIDEVKIFEFSNLKHATKEKIVVINYFGYKEKQSFAENPQNPLSTVLHIIDDKFVNPQTMSSEKIGKEIKCGKLGELCNYNSVIIPLWNSDGYKAVITYRNTGNKINFILKDGEELFIKTPNGNIKFMELSKFVPATIEQAICLTAYGKDELPKGYVLKGDKISNRWVITSTEEKQDNINCNPYVQSQDNSTERYFTILDGFVLAFIDIPDNHLIYLESVEMFMNE
jgi:hypothetical protein